MVFTRSSKKKFLGDVTYVFNIANNFKPFSQKITKSPQSEVSPTYQSPPPNFKIPPRNILTLPLLLPENLVYLLAVRHLHNIFETSQSSLTLSCIILKNGLTLKILRYEHSKIFKVCLAIFQHHA